MTTPATTTTLTFLFLLQNKTPLGQIVGQSIVTILLGE